MKRFLLLLVSLLALSMSSSAMILLGGDNDANTTDPGWGGLWDAVGKITNSSGATTGSAVYLGNGYVLTAAHIQSAARVTFDGNSFFDIDPSFHSSFSTNVDLKLHRLTDLPSIAGVSLLNTASESLDTVYLIGWGLGRGAAEVGELTVPWGGPSTITKRWGLNVLSGWTTVSGAGYSSSGWAFHLDAPGVGPNEAALTQYDSGSGVFQLIDGEWYLVGISLGVQVTGTSVFGSPGHVNAGVRLSPYYEEIMANMEAIPEPAALALLLPACLWGALRMARRKS